MTHFKLKKNNTVKSVIAEEQMSIFYAFLNRKTGVTKTTLAKRAKLSLRTYCRIIDNPPTVLIGSSEYTISQTVPQNLEWYWMLNTAEVGNQYRHHLRPVPLVKLRDIVQETNEVVGIWKGEKFSKGDLVVPDNNIYDITNSHSICKVLGEVTSLDEVDLEVVSGDPEYIGKVFPVDLYDANLVKLGSVATEDCEGCIHDLIEEEANTSEVPVKQEASFIMTENALVLTMQGEEPKLIDFTHPNFKVACALCEQGYYEEAVLKMDLAKAITSYSEGAIEVDVETETLTYKGMPIVNGLTTRILTMMSEGDDAFKTLVKFFEKAQSNPAPDARRQLMEFACASNIAITEEGNVTAFKNVKEDLKPSRIGMYDAEGNYLAEEYYVNEVGKELTMPRELVNEDINVTCARGLHVCSLHYLETMWGYNGRTLRVEVNPRDFVAIPTDYNNSKARVCAYTVVEDVTDNLEEVRETYTG